MSEKEINEAYVQIRLLTTKKRLKEALIQLESYLWQCTDWSLRNRLEQVQTSYNYMLQYMQQGVADPERKKLYTKIQANVLEIADQARLTQLDGISNHYYHDCRNKRTAELAPHTIGALMHILESFNDDLAVSGLLSEAKMDAVLKRHEDTQKFMFLQIWANSTWTLQDEADAQAMLQSEQLTVNDLCLFTSAVTLSLMECFDIRKLMWLIDAYQHSVVQVNQRALVGMAFTLHIYSDRMEYYPEIANRIELLNEEVELDEDLIRAQQQILMTQETEAIDKRMREEIIPEMLKNVSSMRDMKLGFEESDEDKDDLNPDWTDMFELSGLGDKLREMNDLQMEGADIYMSAFSPLKTDAFFREPHNWFYPFDKQHSSVFKELKNKGESASMMDLLLQSGFFCNSDKYSLFFFMQNIPQAMRNSVFSQLTDQQLNEFAEQSKAETLKRFSERPATVSNQYLHDLYRFFKLSARHHEFRDIFKEKIELYDLPLLKEILTNVDFLLNLANFHLKRKHWEKTVELYRKIAAMNSYLNSKDEFYQRMGYALQKQKRYGEAIEAYLKADTIKADNVWTNRHLATCYRMNQEYRKALEYYRKAEATAQANTNIVFYIGSCLAQLHQYEEALNYFFKLDYLENDCVKAWRGIGWCSFLGGKLQQAMKYYDKVIEKKPLPMDYLNAGHISWVSGQMEKAVALYTQSTGLYGSRDTFLEMFQKDKPFLINQGIAEEDIPLMLDLL